MYTQQALIVLASRFHNKNFIQYMSKKNISDVNSNFKKLMTAYDGFCDFSTICTWVPSVIERTINADKSNINSKNFKNNFPPNSEKYNLSELNLTTFVPHINKKSNFLIGGLPTLTSRVGRIPFIGPVNLTLKKYLSYGRPLRRLDTTVYKKRKGKKRAIKMPEFSTEVPHDSLIHPDVAVSLNDQIQAELYAGYTYLSMGVYFGRNDIALLGCEKYFCGMHEEELGHAKILIRYLNMRGGKVVLKPILPPDTVDWKTPLASLQAAVNLEKDIKNKLIALYKVANTNHDYSLEDLLANFFILEQEKSISGLSRLISRYSRMDPDCGLSTYIFDEEMGKTTGIREFEKEDFEQYSKKGKHKHC